MGKAIRLYVWKSCPYCKAAERLLNEKNLNFLEIDIYGDNEMRKKLQLETDHYTVPYIFIGQTFIGGYTEMKRLMASGKWDKMLK